MISEITNGITNSLKRVLLGLFLFLASFVVLFLNEGGPDSSEIAEDSIEINNIETIDKNEINKEFISMTGTLETNESLEDTYLRKGNYIQIKRIVEIYSKNQESERESEEKKYERQEQNISYSWKENIEDINQIKEYYKDKAPTSQEQTVKHITLSGYQINTNEIELPDAEELILTQENTIQTNNAMLLNQKYLFNGKGSLNNPQLGDIRIHYQVIPSPVTTATIFGKIDTYNKILSPYYYDEDKPFFRAFNTTRENAIYELEKENATTSWVFRFIGFALMWTGLLFFIAPLHEVIQKLPFIGEMGSIGIIAITGFISFILSGITIFLSVILHNILFIIAGIILIILGLLFYKKNKNDKPHNPLVA